MDVYIFLFLGLFSRFTGTDGQQKSYIAESANVFTTAFLKYNKYFRPYNESSDPVQVNVRVDFVRILDVDTDASSMTSIVDIRLQWVDGRLYWYSDIIKHVTVNSTEVWTPDVYFLNMESRPEILIEPRFLTIESTGKVYWYQRAKLRTPCTTESEGEFSCSVTFGSMQFPQSELDFKRIICDNPESQHGKVNVTSCVKEEAMDDLSGVPFLQNTVKRGMCIVNVSVDMEAKKRDQLQHYKVEPRQSSMTSSSVCVLVNLVTIVIPLTFALVM
ncbi:acetylcholine receptor subunit alpha-like isoform X1 [Ostrea edulis]|uniref:acetylcholine receptor subunit alpha-like isoform X1 n=1 Tax=Ostrea edulis TaxID=37623 RepID=UPI0024AEF43B|nr:acetylcholine receptor subunit alpha-like isoform X1 [Ostrea edulis]